MAWAIKIPALRNPKIAVTVSNIVVVLGPAMSGNVMQPRTVKRKTSAITIQRGDGDFRQQVCGRTVRKRGHQGGVTPERASSSPCSRRDCELNHGSERRQILSDESPQIPGGNLRTEDFHHDRGSPHRAAHFFVRDPPPGINEREICHTIG